MLTTEIPFYESEIECNCGCGRAMKQDTLIRKLVMTRWIADTPFIITSWNRCPAYNDKIGGVPDSEHIKGYAVDIQVHNSMDRYDIILAAMKAGFKRIGVYPWGLHLGTDPDKPQNVMWIGG